VYFGINLLQHKVVFADSININTRLAIIYELQHLYKMDMVIRLGKHRLQ